MQTFLAHTTGRLAAGRPRCRADWLGARGPHHKRQLLELCARIGYTPPTR